MPEYRYRYLGIDKHGFTYFLKNDNYVYQWFPYTDYFVNGKNMIGKPNGWICLFSSWKNSLHKLILNKEV